MYETFCHQYGIFGTLCNTKWYLQILYNSVFNGQINSSAGKTVFFTFYPRVYGSVTRKSIFGLWTENSLANIFPHWIFQIILRNEISRRFESFYCCCIFRLCFESKHVITWHDLASVYYSQLEVTASRYFVLIFMLHTSAKTKLISKLHVTYSILVRTNLM